MVDLLSTRCNVSVDFATPLLFRVTLATMNTQFIFGRLEYRAEYLWRE